MKTKEQIIHFLRPVFERNNARFAILFGSYAKGTQCKYSDIDILVDSGLHGLDFFGLLEEVCSAVNMPVDLIDTYQLKDDTLLREAKDTGIMIYERT